jgi:hypothetical protein
MDFAEIEASNVRQKSLSATTGLVGTPNGTRTAYESLEHFIQDSHSIRAAFAHGCVTRPLISLLRTV